MERKYKAFAFTIRPKQGLTENLKLEFLDWIKNKDGGFAVLEGEGESLHMHGGIFLEVETTKSNFNMQLQRHFEKHKRDEDSIKVQRGGTRILYDMNFLNNYLNKQDSRTIYQAIPDNVDDYFPSQEEQECAKNKCVDSVLAEYDLLIRENYKWENFGDVHEHFDEWLYDLWFRKKLVKAPREKKKKRELSDNLKRWMFPNWFGIDW